MHGICCCEQLAWPVATGDSGGRCRAAQELDPTGKFRSLSDVWAWRATRRGLDVPLALCCGADGFSAELRLRAAPGLHRPGSQRPTARLALIFLYMILEGSSPLLCVHYVCMGLHILHRKADLEVLSLLSCYRRFVTLQLMSCIKESIFDAIWG